MSASGGGVDIEVVLRSLGKEEVLRVAEEAGLKPRNGRFRCPFQGCADKGDKRRDTVTIYPGKHKEPRLQCHACGKDGRLPDLLAAVKGWTELEAIRHLKGLPEPAVRPVRLVQPEPPLADDKLKPEELKAIWEKLAPASEPGEDYLLSRGLDEAVSLGLVRFATTDHPNRKVQHWARAGRLVVALMKDVVGQPRGLQARLVVAGEPKIASLKGSSTSKAFFGFPELIETSAVVAIAEGLADTCALAQWAAGHPVCVVGAAGKDALPKIAEELKRCDIPVDGRVFALFPQNDRPLNKSRALFDRLAQLLSREGAHVVMCSTHEEYKDLADWLKANPDAHWPPPPLATVLGGEVEHATPATVLVEPVRGGLPIAERVEVSAYGQNFSTLVALLDDPVHREAIMGRRGELAHNEMTGEVDFAGVELDETDISGIRLRIELHAKTPEGRTLKFSQEDIWRALAYLSKRKKLHPVRDWLVGTKWDGLRRLDEELARAFGLEWPSLEAHLFRKWFISAAARGIEPGCKVDTVIVLQGEESLRKSTFFELMGGRFFTNSPVAIGDADGFSVLRRKWIIEWGELDSMRRARDQESIKAFLSSREDFFRPKWGKGHISVPRSCVIVGTTNHSRFLQEAQGNRRFWPIQVRKVDHRWARENREQLWAEAVAIYQGALACAECKPLLPYERCDEHRWWLEDEMAPVLRDHNLGFQEVDEWIHVIRDYIAEKAPQAITVHGLLENAIKKPAGQWVQKDRHRVADALKTLGWSKAPGRRHAGEIGSFWVPPGQLGLGDHPAARGGDHEG
jgi:predicted P-loop ATPase